MRRGVIILLWLPLTALGMVEESGSLYGFMLDTCSTCAYDNWLSHVSENNVRQNYNDYGPPNLDPVTNGFGGFAYIPENAEGDATLARWQRVFEFAIDNRWPSVDSMLMLFANEWNYELVHLREVSLRCEHYILRERLDSSFVDTNGDSLAANDVIGGFRNGWGVFVFNPSPRHARAIVQVPHPQDDYMAPPVATDMFMRAGLSIFMLAGAGREVMWDTTQSLYDNSLSFSDPSRNRRHPFAILTEVVKDAWDTPPVSPFIVIQVHSYDHNEHYPIGDLQVSAFRDDDQPNMPLRDVGAHRDFIHALGRFPVQGIDGDETIITPVNEYISLWCDPRYSYFGEDTVLINSINDFLGAPENQQALYCHENHDMQFDTENFLHIELDEYPDALWSPTNFLRWLPGGPPARLSNFRVVLEYYSTLIDAIDLMLTWHEIPDVTPPQAGRILSVTENSSTSVWVNWQPAAFDQHFDTYEIFYDTEAISETSPSKTRLSSASYTSLGNQNTTNHRVYSLTSPLDRYRFAIRARDLAGNVSPLSPEWGIIDSVIHDVRLHMDGANLKLDWTGQYYDDYYEVWEFPYGAGGYYIIGTTDTTTFSFAPDNTGYGASIIMVKRNFSQ